MASSKRGGAGQRAAAKKPARMASRGVSSGQSRSQNARGCKFKPSESKNPVAPSFGARACTVVETALACALWMIVAFALFPRKDMFAMCLIGVAYFVALMSMLAVRCALEARRRYGRSDLRSCFYYSQQLTHDQKWSLWICLSFFAVFTVMRWLFPSPNLNMTALDIATCAYMGYIWTSRYRDEHAPYQYMESVFLVLVVFSNYIVYFVS